MKVIISANTDSGVLRVRSELINELLALHYEVVVVAPQGKDYSKLVNMGCRFLSVRIDRHGLNPLSDLSTYKQYISILKEEKPDVVLLFSTKPNIYCGRACRRLNIPAVMNITGMGSALGNRGVIQTIMIHLYRLACNGENMKRIFFQNDDSFGFFKKKRIGDPSVYQRIPGSGVNLEQYGIQVFPDSKTVDFLFVARVMKQKGIDQYIEAAKQVRQQYPEAVFHVLGDCDEDYKGVLEEENRNGTIVYHGRVDNVLDFQKLSQCTIQPSYYPEGMSNVILEAAASGRPVITTDHPGCREGVDDGITGLIVPIKDTEALSKAIIKILNMGRDGRIAMGMRGRNKMEREFDRKIVTNAYLKILKG